MTNLTRRAFGAVALAAPVLISGTAPLLAQSAAPAAHPASVFGATIGAYRVTALLDGILPMSTAWFPGGSPDAFQSALAKSGITGDSLPAPINAFLLQSDDATILVDAGLGGLDMMGPGFGQISAGLTALGLAPSDIDTLVMTHAHADHIGGMIGANGAAFPNAELVVTGAEHAFWTDAGIMAQVPDEVKSAFQLAQAVFGAYAGRIKLVESGAEIAPGVTMEIVPGHTMGHAVLHIDGGDRQLLMVTDAVHSIDLQTALPEQGTMFDTDPVLAAQSRVRLFDRAASDNILIAGCHVHFPGFGRIVSADEAYRYVPASILS
ncbi:MAG: MBL fold metallo-hydrolase [Gammaproteobacteria bacterium]|nr:MBL fold metallo-hydrolase [Gammaproteobacteria bacterium]